MSYFRSILDLSPLKITVGYCLFGLIWIPTTDAILAVLFESQGMPTAIGLLKGWLFIALSGLLIFSFSRLHHQQMSTAQTRLRTANQQLRVLHRVFRHNIRNDLNLIQGYTDLASDRVRDPTTLSQLETIEETAEQINSINQKLNIVNQVEPTISDDTTVDLADLVSHELDRLRTSHPEVTITTDMPDEAWIRGEESIRYAIREVLENAVSHFDGTRDDCELAIDIERTGRDMTLEISDNGPGIPSEELAVVQSEEETPLAHGSSVGLWLIVWLTRLHSGAVEFSTDPGSGTTVTFEFEAVEQMAVLELQSSSMEKLRAV